MSTSIFSPEALAQIVSKTIPAATDSTHHNAIVAGVDQNGIQVVARFEKVGNGWALDTDAVAEHLWTGDNEIGAHVILKW